MDMYEKVQSDHVHYQLPYFRAQPDITSGSGCQGNFKCPDSGLPVFFLPGLRTYQSFRNGEKPLI